MRKLVVVAAVMGAAAGALAGVPVASSRAAAQARLAEERDVTAARVDARQRELLRRLLVAERTLARSAP